MNNAILDALERIEAEENKTLQAIMLDMQRNPEYWATIAMQCLLEYGNSHDEIRDIAADC